MPAIFCITMCSSLQPFPRVSFPNLPPLVLQSYTSSADVLKKCSSPRQNQGSKPVAILSSADAHHPCSDTASSPLLCTACPRRCPRMPGRGCLCLQRTTGSADGRRVPFWLAGATCDGEEASLTDCPGFALGSNTDACGESDILSIVCFNGPDPCALRLHWQAAADLFMLLLTNMKANARVRNHSGSLSAMSL